ncbi:hypothetical protein AAC387_Pa02g1709 [Persea americana]
MKEKTRKRQGPLHAARKISLQIDAEEEEDQDEEDALIYKGQRRCFDFQERLYEASPRATLMSPRSDWAAAEETTRSVSSAFLEGHQLPRADEGAHLGKNWTSTTVIRTRKSFRSELIAKKGSTTTVLLFRALATGASTTAFVRQPSSDLQELKNSERPKARGLLCGKIPLYRD